MALLYTYNENGEYTGTQEAQKRPNGEVIVDVLGATLVAPPSMVAGHVAKWNGETWEVLEDHRQHYDANGVKSGGTPYWLDGDTWQSPARYMTELGALPDGAWLEKPEKPEPTTDELSERVRTERDARITNCDWVISRHAEQVALSVDTTLTSDEYTAWLTYRQELRDLPSVTGFPWDGVDSTPWPTEPTT